MTQAALKRLSDLFDLSQANEPASSADEPGDTIEPVAGQGGT